MNEQAIALRERFEKYVERLPMGECWIWVGGLQGDGYGTFRIDSKTTQLAHRVSYSLYRGNLPAYSEGELDHLCRNRCCVRPDHLEVVTTRENVLRGTNPAAKQARQTHCRRGHELVEGNLYWFGRKRYCRKCHLDYNKAKYAERRKNERSRSGS